MSFEHLPRREPKRRRSTRPANARKFKRLHFDLSHMNGCYNNVMNTMAARFKLYGLKKDGEPTTLPETGLFTVRFKGPEGCKEEEEEEAEEEEEHKEEMVDKQEGSRRRYSTGGKKARRGKKHREEKKEQPESSKAKAEVNNKYLYLVFKYKDLYLTGCVYKRVYYKLNGIKHDPSDLIRTEKMEFYQKKEGVEESIKKTLRRANSARRAAKRAARRTAKSADAHEDAEIDQKVAIALGAKRCCILPFGESYNSIGVDFTSDIPVGGPALLDMFEALTSIEQNLDGHHGRLHRAFRTAIVMFSEASRFPSLRRAIAIKMKQSQGELNGTICCIEAKEHFKNWSNYAEQIRLNRAFVKKTSFDTLSGLVLFVAVLLVPKKNTRE